MLFRSVLGPGGVGFLTGVTAIATSYAHTLALKGDGTVLAWGVNAQGQLGDATTTGRTTPVQVVGPGGSGVLTGVSAIATGALHSVALLNDGTVWAWGYNNSGQLGDGTTTNRSTPVQVKGPGGAGYLMGVTAIATGDSHSVALLNDGTVWAWGENFYGSLGDGSTTKSAAPVQVVEIGRAHV